MTCTIDGDPYRLPDERANALLQIAREALSNVAKHARATRVDVHLAYDAHGVTLTVADDGRGFDPTARRAEQHRGLRNLRARAEEAGGTFALHSAPGAGTTLAASVPAPH